jgi:pimeloyl-ACP methyl ester carboxylesterase
MSSQQAIRTDKAAGHTDVIEFFGTPGQQMLVTTHLPLGSPTAGLVICSSLRAEFETNYRREILLGRALAARGIAVHRFQYRGTGNSDGDTRLVTFDSMQLDAHAATARFLETTGLDRVAFMGTRLGGTVAAAVASTHDDAPIVLWEPVTDAVKYYRQIFRTRSMWSVHGSDDEGPSTSAMDEFRTAGSIDIVGYPIDSNLYDSVVTHDLADELGTGPRPVLLVQLGGRGNLKRDLARLVDTWTAAGPDVAAEVVDEDESWWLEHPGERQEKRTMNSSPAIDVTVEWLTRAFDGGLA